MTVVDALKNEGFSDIEIKEFFKELKKARMNLSDEILLKSANIVAGRQYSSDKEK